MSLPLSKVHEALAVLGIEDSRFINYVHMEVGRIEVKQFLTNDEGRVYWDDAYDGAAYICYSIPVNFAE